ncbi:hypothetical protein GE09DRAFT_564480 [Coniochaeta sp. 2T2.1]|nr:hypothetical protein GE09DRAFT_564480 [Coniochaeta sp. 2T2.1]
MSRRTLLECHGSFDQQTPSVSDDCSTGYVQKRRKCSRRTTSIYSTRSKFLLPAALTFGWLTKDPGLDISDGSVVDERFVYGTGKRQTNSADQAQQAAMAPNLDWTGPLTPAHSRLGYLSTPTWPYYGPVSFPLGSGVERKTAPTTTGVLEVVRWSEACRLRWLHSGSDLRVGWLLCQQCCPVCLCSGPEFTGLPHYAVPTTVDVTIY